ncbi:MAG: hypothetical protein P4L46_01370 [Fimbriimonas sp.]|nr:hypothetical protein [Fimbriimonas sp.]
MKNPTLVARLALVSAVVIAVIGCQHPPEAGSLDPHGPYTAAEARAAGAAAIKARGAMGRPGSNQAHGGPAGASSGH